MTKSELNKFRDVLQARVADLEAAGRRREMISIEGTPDSYDGRLEAIEREVAAHTLARAAAKLRERDAIERIEDGTYGICVECEQPIAAARLNAVPWAGLCIRCQEVVDSQCDASSGRTR